MLRARNPTERVNSGLHQTFLEIYSENRDVVTAVLSYEQINVRNGAQRADIGDGSPWDRDQNHDLLRIVIVSLHVSVSFIADLGAF
jgi:hypothetical protein